MKDESLKDELARLSPRLTDLSGQDDGFRVPDGYFEAFEDRLLGRIADDSIQRPAPALTVKKPARRVQMYRWVAAAAAVLTIIFAAIWFFKPAPVDTPQYASVQLSDEEIESYLLKNMQDFEDDQLALLREDETMSADPKGLPQGKLPKHNRDSLNDISPEDMEHVINDMTEEELEAIL